MMRTRQAVLVGAFGMLLVTKVVGAVENGAVQERLAGISFPFLENEGQMDARVAY